MQCSNASPSMSIPGMMSLIENCPPGPWPDGWAHWDNTIAAHAKMAQDKIDRLRINPDPDDAVWPRDKGIVIAGGGLKYFPSVWVNVNMIRYMGCSLPIQLWYLGDLELDPYMKRLLEPLGVECIDATKLLWSFPCRILCGWELKIYATLLAPFQKVLFLDADNAPVRDVTPLFDHPEFVRYGAVFWPDYSMWQLKPDIWKIFDISWMIPRAHTERAFESGQYMVDKAKCGRELEMALWYAEHSDFTFKHVYGDKECFHLAWRKMKTEYAMPAKDPGWDVHTIVQWDFDGNRVWFQHRCQDKWRLGGNNRHNPSLANEDLCFQLCRDLADLWSGVPWSNSIPTLAEQEVIASLLNCKFEYERVGHDKRPIRLGPNNFVTEGKAECEERWWVNMVDDVPILTLSRVDRPTCHLRKTSDGTWEGRWLEFEKMLVRLTPCE